MQDLERQFMAALAPLLGRGDKWGVFEGSRWRRCEGDASELLRGHLAGRHVLGAVHGGQPTSRLVAWDIDGSSHKPTHDAGSAASVLHAVLVGLGLAPPLWVTSRSGHGIHCYALCSGAVPTPTAAALALRAKAMCGRPEIDCTYPSRSAGDGLVLALPWCAMTGGRPAWLADNGSRVCDSLDYRPLPLAAQLPSTIAEWPRSGVSVLEAALERAGGALPQIVTSALESPPRHVSPRPLPIYRCELDVLVEHCAFVQECANVPAAMTYEMWFSLATVLRVFDGGSALFHAISRSDAPRYNSADADRKLASIQGRPRRCDNLGWPCPKRTQCDALSVRSPAGLPYKLKLKPVSGTP